MRLDTSGSFVMKRLRLNYDIILSARSAGANKSRVAEKGARAGERARQEEAEKRASEREKDKEYTRIVSKVAAGVRLLAGATCCSLARFFWLGHAGQSLGSI